MKEKQIHWFPGHMKKAQNQIIERLKIVDSVIELLDARIPFSSRNDFLFKISKDKERLVVLTKYDLADPKITSEWIRFFEENEFKAIFADLNNQKDVNNIIALASSLGAKKREKDIARGLKPRPVRAMIIGIPNVGKSTLINKIAHRKAASVENKPGHTKSQQWIKVSNQFELLDTPGILESNYEDKKKALNLALVGSISEKILPNDDLAIELLKFLKEFYPDLLKVRYGFDTLEKEHYELLGDIAKKRGYLSKGEPDLDKAALTLLNEFKNGVIGRCSLERDRKSVV